MKDQRQPFGDGLFYAYPANPQLQIEDFIAGIANHECSAVLRSSRLDMKGTCRENWHKGLAFAFWPAVDRTRAPAIGTRYDNRGQNRLRLSDGALLPTAGAAASWPIRAIVA